MQNCLTLKQSLGYYFTYDNDSIVKINVSNAEAYSKPRSKSKYGASIYNLHKKLHLRCLKSLKVLIKFSYIWQIRQMINVNRT